MRRLEHGGLIDRMQRVRFTFDGKNYSGYRGDTLASALLASNVKLVARSFKYHRPRGILTSGSEEPNALAEIGENAFRVPNSRMTTQLLYEGMLASSQNAFPSLKYDLSAVNDKLSRFLGAGFYYKTFMGPVRSTKFWMFCEKFIRHAAGLGRAATADDHAYFEQIHAHTDILVVGAGPAGLWAAYVAGLSGAKVILADENFTLGSNLIGSLDKIDGIPLYQWGAEIVKKLRNMPNVTLLASSTMFGFYDGNIAGLLERVGHNSTNVAANPEIRKTLPVPYGIPYERRWKIYFSQAIIATGAIERPLIFENNDLPGIMLAGAVRRYIHEYAVLPCDNNAVLFTNNNAAYQTAFDLHDEGVQSCIIDSRDESALAAKARDRGIAVYCNAVVSRALGKQGMVKFAEVRSFDAETGTLGRDYQRIPADLLAISGGFTPAVHLLCHLGDMAEIKNGNLIPPKKSPFIVAGSAMGADGLKAVMASAQKAAMRALADRDKKTKNLLSKIIPPKVTQNSYSTAAMPLWEVPSSGNEKKFVDFQHDVTAKDLHQAASEGYGHPEHAKRYTTAAMATDQGKIASMNIAGILASARGVPLAQMGVTSYRPPYTPVSLGAFAGTFRAGHLQPTRLTPMDGWHRDNGAVMVEAGQWMRPRYYRQHGRNMREAYIYEMRHVRSSAGLCDVSTLGKIDIAGADAAEFINRVYVNKFLKLPIGKARYGVMLREDGYVFDDGTCARVGENRFYMTTTTAGAAAVMRHLEYYLAVIWPELKVRVTSVSDQWAAMALSGPLSRQILEKLTSGVDNQSLPFMGVKDVLYREIPLRIMRISFSGELAYELHTPARYGLLIWRTLLKLGGRDIVPYGTETLGALRIEKGHIAGAEIRGHTTLLDVGLGAMAADDKHYIGQMLMRRDGLLSNNREQLVGLKIHLHKRAVQGGAIIMQKKSSGKESEPIGRVSSATYSVMLAQNIALALVKNGRQRHGERVIIRDFMRGVTSEAEICDPIFYDKTGEKLRG